MRRMGLAAAAVAFTLAWQTEPALAYSCGFLEPDQSSLQWWLLYVGFPVLGVASWTGAIAIKAYGVFHPQIAIRLMAALFFVGLISFLANRLADSAGIAQCVSY